jgi:hypothetical protein
VPGRAPIAGRTTTSAAITTAARHPYPCAPAIRCSSAWLMATPLGCLPQRCRLRSVARGSPGRIPYRRRGQAPHRPRWRSPAGRNLPFGPFGIRR